MPSAEEIGRRARALGHEVTVIERPPPPEHPDGFTKYWFECTCGARLQKVARSRVNATSWAVHHLLMVTTEPGRSDRVNGGVSRPRPADASL